MTMSHRRDRDPGTFSLERVAGASRVLPARSYEGLRTGTHSGRSYETQAGIPVDGSKRLLRSLSPFTISILPPLVFENVPVQSALDSLKGILSGLGEEARNVLFNVAGLFSGDESPDIGQRVVAIANAEWEKVIKEPDGSGPNGASVIDNYIRNRDSSYFHWLPQYTHNRQKDSDWCGHFAAFVYGQAGLGEEARHGNMQSTSRIYRWARDNPQRLVGGVDGRGFPVAPDPSELRPGDIIVVGPTDRTKEKKAGNHIALVESVDSAGVWTVEGNAGAGPKNQGRLGDGSHGEGVIKAFRPFSSSDPEEYVVLYGVRPTPDDYDTPFYGDSAYSEAGFSGPIQSRNSSSPRTPSPGYVDVALARNDSFRSSRDARTRGLLSQIGLDGGSMRPEEFVSSGLLRKNKKGGFDEPGFADKVVAVDIVAQLDAILRTPPLTLLINPSSLTHNLAKVQQYSQRSRYGHILQAWGEEQRKISISGSIGAYIAAVNPQSGVSTDGSTPSPSGVQFASKRDSASFQNLMNLLLFYRNNGYIYDSIGKSDAHQFVGAIAIEYDQWTYVGHFESFTWAYEADSPGGKVNFDIEFTASQVYDNHRPSTSLQPMRSPTRNPGDLGSSILDSSSVPFPVDELGASSQRPAESSPRSVPSSLLPQVSPVVDIEPGVAGFVFTEEEVLGDQEDGFLDFSNDAFDAEGNLLTPGS